MADYSPVPVAHIKVIIIKFCHNLRQKLKIKVISYTFPMESKPRRESRSTWTRAGACFHLVNPRGALGTTPHSDTHSCVPHSNTWPMAGDPWARGKGQSTVMPKGFPIALVRKKETLKIIEFIIHEHIQRRNFPLRTMVRWTCILKEIHLFS